MNTVTTAKWNDDRLPAAFWAKTTFKDNTGCWLWTGSVNVVEKRKYARYYIDHKYRYAHKVTYVMFRNLNWVTVPYLQSICDSSLCVNPDHWKPASELVSDRFWRKVHKSSGCWNWQGGLDEGGYGIFDLNGKTQRAHRVAYELARVPIPRGLCVLHTCDNPQCVRPDHLRLGTVKTNNQDRAKKGGYVKTRRSRVTKGINDASPDARALALNAKELKPAATRFWQYVQKGPGCWLWKAGCSTGRGKLGYGVFFFEGKSLAAHRVAYALNYGHVPKRQCVLHRCDNPLCVRPSHLFLGTTKVNNRDRARKGRSGRVKNTWSAGENNGSAKLCWKAVHMIRASRRQGVKWKVLQKEFGIGRTMLTRILNNSSWIEP